MDAQVLAAQQWVNSTYAGRPGYAAAPETGLTGWSTMYALTRALQIQLGISPPSNTFGPGTASAVAAISPMGQMNAPHANIVRIIQSALWCKGYTGGPLDGSYGPTVANSVSRVQFDLGIPQTSTVDVKLLKSLLTMDAYVISAGGTPEVREAQRWMNATYISKPWFDVVPADGNFSRVVHKAFLYAIQDELSVAGANGNYGPATRSAVNSAPLITTGTTDGPGSNWVRLFQAAMRFNGLETTFDGSYGSNDATSISTFQEFCTLPVTGGSDYQTWSSLLVSNGDPTRHGSAADCSETVTAPRAAALVADGREVVGRYLTNAAGSSFNKMIQPGELETIFAAGLRVFPIFQTVGSHSSYFTHARGVSDANEALSAAVAHGFPRGTRIYFAVDFDALGSDIANGIIPYFRGVNERMEALASRYRVGVYGGRNVCTTVSIAGYADLSFVSGMSYAFSANLGYPLPTNWAFDQISTVVVGYNEGTIQIDNNLASGREPAVVTVTPPPAPIDVRDTLADLAQFSLDVSAYCDTVESNTTGLAHGTPANCLAKLMESDALLTELSQAYGVRKALIQSVAFWEYWKTTFIDTFTDIDVQNFYTYKVAYEIWEEGGKIGDPPVVVAFQDDCSTGFAQIFARTAIRAHNWKVFNNYSSGALADESDWHDVWSFWQRLHGSDEQNLTAVPGVLLWGAEDGGVTGPPRLTYTPTEVEQILARYNGTGPAAAAYGAEVKGIYDLFEARNLAMRT